MKSALVLKEALDYIRRYQGKIFVVKVSKAVLEWDYKLSNVIQDIRLLMSAGIRFVIAHSDPKCNDGFWKELGSVAALDSKDLSRVGALLDSAVTPIVFFRGTDSAASEEEIVALAKMVRAEKIIYVTKADGIFQVKNVLVSEMNVQEAQNLLAIPDEAVTLDMQGRLKAAVKACGNGIARVHIVGSREGSLLKEVLTCKGSGTMIFDQMYQELRPARKTDVGEIFEVIQESIGDSADSISLDFISEHIGHFFVFAVDGQVNGCVMVRTEANKQQSEIMLLSISAAYESSEQIRRLVEHALNQIPVEHQVSVGFEKNIVWLGMYPWLKQLGFFHPNEQSRCWIKSPVKK